MERWCGKVAVVTGASGGIGACIAEKLVKAGCKVVGLARGSEKIEAHAKKLAGCKGKLYACKADMTCEQDIVKAFEWIAKNLGPVHILINNAGLMTTTNIADGDAAAWKQVFDTNVIGLAIATREALKSMRMHKIDGHIVHINSVVGHKVIYFPGSGLYSASKFAVSAYHESLKQELNMLGCNVKLTSLSPGAVKTNFLEAAGENVKGMMKEAVFLNAEDVADAIMYVLSTPPHVQIHELIIKPTGEKF